MRSFLSSFRRDFKVGGLEFNTYPLRYINLFPSLSAISVVADEPVDVPDTDQQVYPVVGRWYQLAVFGQVFSVCVPSTKTKRSWSMGIGGPHWSRTNKRWSSPRRVKVVHPILNPEHKE